MKLILASASPRRAEILRTAGLQFSVLSSAVDETVIPGETPQDLVRRLALAKAELVAARALGPAIIIAADTVVVLESAILGKPRTSEDARQMLEKLSGRTHSVMTGIALIRLPLLCRRVRPKKDISRFLPRRSKRSAPAWKKSRNIFL